MVFGKLIYLANAVFFNSNSNNNNRPILKIDRDMWIDKHQFMIKQPAPPASLS